MPEPVPGLYLRGQRHEVRLVAAILLLCAMLFATVASAQQTPDFPPLNGRIVDQAGLLDEAASAKLTKRLAQHEKKTGNQIVVATLATLDGYDIADYSNRLARAWQIGTAENDNGVVLVVAPEERKVRIEVGYGLEGALTDATSRIIIERQILPAFRSDDYAGGIEAGVDAILQAVAGEYKAPTEREQQDSGGIYQALIPLLFLGMIGVTETLRRSGMRRAANGAFPAGMAGVMGTAVSGHLLVGIAAALGLFAVIWFFGRSGGGTGSGARHRRRTGVAGGAAIGTGGFGGGFGGGGGFSGGGGGFGGGGASGGW